PAFFAPPGEIMVPLVRATVAAVLASLLTGCGPPNYVMMTSAMAPTIERGDIIVIDMKAYDHARPRRGEMVAYRAPDGPEGKLLMGRVVAAGGEEVSVRDGTLRLDGRPVDEPFVAEEMDYEVEAMQVPDGHVYILGDNRNDATDSHVFGPAPLHLIEGRITDVRKPPE
ncbi:MAG: signal peptidase I, partial [Armatimonadota bacterium]